MRNTEAEKRLKQKVTKINRYFPTETRNVTGEFDSIKSAKLRQVEKRELDSTKRVRSLLKNLDNSELQKHKKVLGLQAHLINFKRA